MWAVCLTSDILPEDDILFTFCSKPPLAGFEQRLVSMSRRGSFLKLDCVLPITAGFKTVVKRLPLRGLFIFITIFTYRWLQKCVLFMQNKYLHRILSFHQKRIDKISLNNSSKKFLNQRKSVGFCKLNSNISLKN